MKNKITRCKTGQFFSLTMFLIMLSVVVLFSIISSIKDDEERFNMDRLKKTVVNNYVLDFDSQYAEQIIHLALKPAVAGVLHNKEQVTKEQLLEIMQDGDSRYVDPDLAITKTFNSVLGTTSYSFDTADFDVKLDKVEQFKPTELSFTFLVSYDFEMEDESWKKTDKKIIISMDVYSLMHPNHEYSLIDKTWIEDTNAIECFSRQVITDAELCTGWNVRPEVSFTI